MDKPTRADLWRETLNDTIRVRRLLQERNDLVELMADFFDKHLGEDWRYNENIEEAFEDALRQIETKLKENV